MNNGNENNSRQSMSIGSEQTNEEVDDDSASYNIFRSKELIKLLEQTAINSATIVQKARSFHETHKMLSVSKTLSANSKGLLKLAAQKRMFKTNQSDSFKEITSFDTRQGEADRFDE